MPRTEEGKAVLRAMTRVSSTGYGIDRGRGALLEERAKEMLRAALKEAGVRASANITDYQPGWKRAYSASVFSCLMDACDY